MSLSDNIEQEGYDANVADVDRGDNPYGGTLGFKWFMGWDRKENEPVVVIPQNISALIGVILMTWQGMQ